MYFHTTRGGQQSKTKQNNCMKSRKVDYRRNIFFSEVSLGHYSSLFSPNSLLSPPPFFYTISPSPSSASSSSSHLPLSLSLSFIFSNKDGHKNPEPLVHKGCGLVVPQGPRDTSAEFSELIQIRCPVRTVE